VNSKEKAEEIARKLEHPRCPECGEKITNLHQKSDVVEVFSYNPIDEGVKDYYPIETCGHRNLGYFCPKCEWKIAQTEKEAKKFLLNGRLPKRRRQKNP